MGKSKKEKKEKKAKKEKKEKQSKKEKKEKKHEKTKQKLPVGINPLTEDDYFLKSEEFRVWLKLMKKWY